MCPVQKDPGGWAAGLAEAALGIWGPWAMRAGVHSCICAPTLSSVREVLVCRGGAEQVGPSSGFLQPTSVVEEADAN